MFNIFTTFHYSILMKNLSSCHRFGHSAGILKHKEWRGPEGSNHRAAKEQRPELRNDSERLQNRSTQQWLTTISHCSPRGTRSKTGTERKKIVLKLSSHHLNTHHRSFALHLPFPLSPLHPASHSESWLILEWSAIPEFSVGRIWRFR